jgi:uncharacterized protein (DUF1778 family)
MAVRTERLDLRMTPEHKQLVEQAAAASGQPVTSFVLTAVLERARATLEQESRTVLSQRGWLAFQRLLAQPEEPAPALTRAVERKRRRGG